MCNPVLQVTRLSAPHTYVMLTSLPLISLWALNTILKVLFCSLWDSLISSCGSVAPLN